MTGRAFNVLILCTGNSARSILGEALVERWGQGRFRGFSAGSHPKGRVHPLALELLEHEGFTTEGLRSKSWDEFAAAGAPPLDFIFTVCDNAAGEACPVWPGHPMTVHWGIDDPAAADGSDEEKRLAFRKAFDELQRRVRAFIDLPIGSLDPRELKQRLQAIGNSRAMDAA
jgi:arsenate reductase (thioredoxin)